MKKLVLFALVALIFAACGGPSASFSKQFNLTQSHPKTKQAYEMVKRDVAIERPGAKILKYTNVGEVKGDAEHKTFYIMEVQVKENGKVENVHYYFPDDWSFATKSLDRLSRYNLGLE